MITKIDGVDFSHARLFDLIRLADQAEPFYKWVEVRFQRETHRGDSLEKIVKTASFQEIKSSILACYGDELTSSTPKLFDGGGVPYQHRKACFFFFSWLVRDAAVQRLQPLISQAIKNSGKNRIDFEAEVIAKLLLEYREPLFYFEWPVFREIAINRLEGSRRAKRGSEIEIFIRTSLSESFSYFYKTRGNYGKYIDFEIRDKPLKVNNRTYDVVAILKREDGKNSRYIVMPVKTRETQGGGHSHLFSRDVEQANKEIIEEIGNVRIITTIIAQNWSAEEIEIQEGTYGSVFYFNQSPNSFNGFPKMSQVRLNKIIEEELMS